MSVVGGTRAVRRASMVTNGTDANAQIAVKPAMRATNGPGANAQFAKKLVMKSIFGRVADARFAARLAIKNILGRVANAQFAARLRTRAMTGRKIAKSAPDARKFETQAMNGVTANVQSAACGNVTGNAIKKDINGYSTARGGNVITASRRNFRSSPSG